MLRRRWTLNLVLLLLVALLSLLAHRELEQERRAPTLTTLAPEGIDEVRLERPGEDPVSLIRGPQGWRMESPYAATGNAERVGQLVRIAATEVYRTMPEGDAAARLGLAPARVRLRLDGLLLRFGDTEPLADLRYVATGGQVHLIGDGFQHHLIAPAEAYVSPRLLPQGFLPAAGTLDGEPLDAQALTELAELEAERVVPMGEEISGRLLSLSGSDGEQGLRLLISADGLTWTRLDLRLAYLLSSPPFWAVSGQGPPAQEPPGEPPPESGGPSGRPRT
jgi:hypothetical protein